MKKKDFWQKDQLKQLREYKFAIERYFETRRSIWQNLIIVIATILGFSLGIISVTGGNPNVCLLIAWSLQIVAIMIGFFLLIVDNESNRRRDMASFEFNYNMNEINIMDAEGKFTGNKELRRGLLFSAMDEFFKKVGAMRGDVVWSKDALKLIEKCKENLPMAKFLKQSEEKRKLIHLGNRIIKWLDRNISPLAIIFYCLVSFSLIFLLLSIFV